MLPIEAAAPAHRANDAGRQGITKLGSSQNPDTAKPPAFQGVSLAAQASKAALVRELFGESLAIGIECAAKSLRHVLAADDNEAIVACRGFLVAAHTATKCARELRGLVEASGQ